MRILFATFVNPALFSGGRYHALLMAEAMAAGGHYVSVWASAKPRFWSDFETLPRHKQIALTIDPSLANPPAGPFDLVMIVPDLRDDPTMYAAALKRAAACEARVGLLSFETPNWFNEHALVERDEALWWYWRETARNADLIVASTALGARYARAFYADPENADAIVSCPPSINSLVADATPAPPRARQIVCLTRFGTRDFHKGGDELTALLHPSLAGLELVVFHGTGAAPSPTALDALHAAAEKARMGLRFLDYTTDAEKFEELKKSAAIVAPSYFEGFGYPPIEALYCGTPCIAFDLPVYRETCGSALITTPPGDMAAMRGAVIDVLEGKQANARPHDTERLRDIASFDRFVDRTNALLSNLQQSTAPRRNTGTIQVRPTPGKPTQWITRSYRKRPRRRAHQNVHRIAAILHRHAHFCLENEFLEALAAI